MDPDRLSAEIGAWLTSGRPPATQVVAAAIERHLTERMALRPMERRIDWGTLAAAAVAVNHRPAWKAIVDAFERNDYDHYLLQRDSGMSRDDLGDVMSSAEAARRIEMYARSTLHDIPGAFAQQARQRLAGTLDESR